MCRDQVSYLHQLFYGIMLICKFEYENHARSITLKPFSLFSQIVVQIWSKIRGCVEIIKDHVSTYIFLRNSSCFFRLTMVLAQQPPNIMPRHQLYGVRFSKTRRTIWPTNDRTWNTPFMPSGLFNPYRLGQCIHHIRGVWFSNVYHCTQTV